MKLKHIHINDYKLFHDFDIDFCAQGVPLSVVVMAGVNGNGKSTLLEYIRPKGMSTHPSGNITIDTTEGEKTYTVPPSAFQTTDYQQDFSSVIYLGNDSAGNASPRLEEQLLKYVDRFVYVEGKTIISKGISAVHDRQERVCRPDG